MIALYNNWYFGSILWQIPQKEIAGTSKHDLKEKSALKMEKIPIDPTSFFMHLRPRQLSNAVFGFRRKVAEGAKFLKLERDRDKSPFLSRFSRKKQRSTLEFKSAVTSIGVKSLV